MKGPLYMFIIPKANLRRECQHAYVVCYKKLSEKAYRPIARFFYVVVIAFNAVNYPNLVKQLIVLEYTNIK